jgi:hypothetical protein
MTGKSIRLEKSSLFLFFLFNGDLLFLLDWKDLKGWVRFDIFRISLLFFKGFSPHHFNCIIFLLGRFQITSGPEQDRNSDRCCIRALFLFCFFVYALLLYHRPLVLFFGSLFFSL